MAKAALVLLVLAAPLAADDQLLRWMDRIAQKQLSEREAAIARITTPEQAKVRQAAVRARLLKLIGGLPDYRGPLNARVTGKVDRPRYVIENVIFESLPKFYVSANLYRPKAAGRFPAILFSMGHWDEGKAAAQRMAANLTMKGFVVLAYDPVGQGERQQAYDPRTRRSLAGGPTDQHFLNGAQAILAGENFARYRIWDGMRALDYLLSRPEVEPGKAGCTGCSGGGTLATYISALDPRITVAAPACYINTWRRLFSGPTGDSEQSFPDFLAAGLDLTDYIELFAPKPWMISSTVADFFPIEGARHAYQESLRWYRVFGAGERVAWTVGPGPHGMPPEVREGIYGWFIRWLKDGRGDPREEDVDLAPNIELLASETGQVGGRELYEVILEGFRTRMKPGTTEELLAEIRKWSGSEAKRPPAVRTVKETPGPEFSTREIAIEVEPGLEIAGMFYTPRETSAKQPVLLVNGGADAAARFAEAGHTVLDVLPRGLPMPDRNLAGDWMAATRAWVIGRNMAGMRAGDIMRAADLLPQGGIIAAARGVEGFWLLLAAAADPRFTRLWLDRTPYSLRAALEEPLSRNLHAAVIPGFALHWDMEDLVKAMGNRAVVWSDPTDWMGEVVPRLKGKSYRLFEENNERFIRELTR
ncbi:MAG TPA: acetylxylan esterase [Bryobacteraceae bacterium]|nr:acetylxylan esterase [Bryobacteraceae bacterium]